MAVETCLILQSESGSEEHPHPIVGGRAVPEWTATCLIFLGWCGDHVFEERHFQWANLQVLRELRREREEQAEIERERVRRRLNEPEREEASPEWLEVETDVDLGDCNQQ